MPMAGDIVRYTDLTQPGGCRARRAANQTIATATVTSIAWDTQDSDPQSFITLAPTATSVVIPSGQSGMYAITFYGFCTTSTTGRCFVQIVPTSGIANMPARFRNPFRDTEDNYAITITVALLAGDSFVCQVFHSSGADRNFTAWLNCQKTQNG